MTASANGQTSVFQRAGQLAVPVVLGWGLWVTFLRYYQGLGAATNMSDRMPWGIWVGFDVLCGVALAAGGFAITGLVYLLDYKRFRPILPATVLTAFLGYILVSVGLLYDLGKPWNMWHVFIMHNPHSVMFEVAWCVILYSTVLTLEFSTLVLERFHFERVVGVISKITIPAVAMGVLLSTLHQSSLGTLFLIVPGKLYKLWYSPYLPFMFFFSAVTVGFAMVIVESYLSSFFFDHSLEKGILVDLSRFLLVAVVFYLAIKCEDLFARKMFGALFEPRLETWCFWLELLLLAIPACLLAFERIRLNQHATFLCATSVVLGVVINRLNVSLVGTYAYTGSRYLPSFRELSVSVFLVMVGAIVFGLAIKYLRIFDIHGHSGGAAAEPLPEPAPANSGAAL